MTEAQMSLQRLVAVEVKSKLAEKQQVITHFVILVAFIKERKYNGQKWFVYILT